MSNIALVKSVIQKKHHTYNQHWSNSKLLQNKKARQIARRNQNTRFYFVMRGSQMHNGIIQVISEQNNKLIYMTKNMSKTLIMSYRMIKKKPAKG